MARFHIAAQPMQTSGDVVVAAALILIKAREAPLQKIRPMAENLVRNCNEALGRGADFPTIWQTIIKPHPAVVGIPVQRVDGERGYIEIPLLRGDWLIVDLDRRKVSLR